VVPRLPLTHSPDGRATCGTTVGVVSTGVRSTGETLEARLEARFAALEAQFAAFAGRAANGFGRCPDAGDEAVAGGQAITVAVATSRPSIALPHRTSADDDSPITRAQQATDGTSERGTARKGKRDRHKGERRNRH
jgi:hypothetical protein